jgi:serine/threonine protein kinase
VRVGLFFVIPPVCLSHTHTQPRVPTPFITSFSTPSYLHCFYYFYSYYFFITSLYHLLHSHAVLPFSIRYRFAQDIVNGLVYMHAMRPPTIHRDMKSLNVLLT